MSHTIPYNVTVPHVSWGRNRGILTSGIYLTGVTRYHHPQAADSFSIHPISSRGVVSGACRVEVAVKAIPELIKALQEIYDNN